MTKTLAPLVLIVAVGCGGGETTVNRGVETDSNASTGTVTVEVVLDGDVKTVQIEGVEDGTTVEALMRRIEDPAVKISGSATTAFVHSIGDVAMSGREGWTFKIDGVFSPEGVGSAILHPPTTISWRYGDFSPPSE